MSPDHRSFRSTIQVSSLLLSHSDEIEAPGRLTSGEIELVVIDDGTRLRLTLGSDHTDRDDEGQSVELSKRLRPKPLAASAWAFDALVERLDGLELQSGIRSAPCEG